MEKKISELIKEMEARCKKHLKDSKTVPDKSLMEGAYYENQYIIQRLRNILTN